MSTIRGGDVWAHLLLPVGAITPVRLVSANSLYAAKHNWPFHARLIAKEAQLAKRAKKHVPAYEWLFRSSDTTYTAKKRFLQKHRSLLKAMKERQYEQKTLPESLSDDIETQLQAELDFFLYQCVSGAVFQNVVDDVPEEVKRCENEYTIHYGVEGRLEMKGNFYDLTDTIKKRLLMNYERCRRVDKHAKDYCQYQATIEVNGKEIKPPFGMMFEVPSLDDLVRTGARYFSNPGKKRPAGFRGGAWPAPVLPHPG